MSEREREPIGVAVVDDELLARQRLEDLLAKEENVRLVATADNGEAAVEMIRREHPDLVFLDVQMPGMTGIEVAREIGPEEMPKTIFVTAFDEFALRAFELAAVDYLVKPFDDERFHQAFERARRMIELEEVGRMTRRLMSLLATADEQAAARDQAPAAARREYLERISVENRGQLRVVPVEKIDYITASGPYAELHVGERTFTIRERMQTLEERLDPSRFFRIHRSAIVRLDTIDTLLHSPGGAYAVRLKDGTELSVSRGRRDELAERMGVG